MCSATPRTFNRLWKFPKHTYPCWTASRTPCPRDRGDEWMISSTTEYETFPIIWRCSLQPLTLNSLKKSHFRRRKKCFIHCSPPSLPPPCKRLRGHSISHPNHQYKRRLFPTWNKIYTTHNVVAERWHLYSYWSVNGVTLPYRFGSPKSAQKSTQKSPQKNFTYSKKDSKK